jgi:hypothetical protein
MIQQEMETKRKSTRKPKAAAAAAAVVPSPLSLTTTTPNVHMTLEEILGTAAVEEDADSERVPETNNVVVGVLDAAAVAAAAVDEEKKKRGRKPKGGKLIARPLAESVVSTAIPNIILHLKCTLAELDAYHAQQSKHMTDPHQYNPEVPPEIQSFEGNQGTTFSMYESAAAAAAAAVAAAATATATATVTGLPSVATTIETVAAAAAVAVAGAAITTTTAPVVLTSDQQLKIKKLKVQLYKNQLNKKSDCFWCTCDFESETVYIPKTMDDTTIYAYGSFCRPECAVSHLMAENLDDSTKFERYHLMNQLYGQLFGYKHNIKPAPNPYYLLDKFYGNLSIHEYRKLLGSDQLLYTLEKPMTRILPELHEVTDEFMLGIYGTTPNSSNKGATQAGGVYKVKRQSEKQAGPSKASIMRGKFGLTQT